MKKAILGAAFTATLMAGTAATAATPLQSSVTANPAALTTSALTTSATGHSATNSASGTLSASNVTVAQFNTASGILVGATVAVNTAVTETTQVVGVVPASGNGRRVDATSSLTGAVSTSGVTFSSGAIAGSHFCTGGNCANSPGNSQHITAGTIVGSSAVPLANLAAYAGTGTIGFTRSASGSATVTNGSNATSGTANALFTFGSATPASNVYSITYDFLNFANPSFNGSINQTALTLDFGTIFHNSAPVTLNFSLFNIGNINSAGLSLTSIGRSTNNLNFTSTLSTFTNGLDGGNSLNYSVTFNPATLGSASDIFTLNLSDFTIGGIGGKTYQLTANVLANVIEAPAPGVPEPATWAMLVLGFGLVGFGARSRRARFGKVSA